MVNFVPKSKFWLKTLVFAGWPLIVMSTAVTALGVIISMIILWPLIPFMNVAVVDNVLSITRRRHRDDRAATLLLPPKE